MERTMDGNEVNAAGAPAGAGVQAPAERPVNDAVPEGPARPENGAAGGGGGASAGLKQRLGELSTDSREFASAAGGVVTDAVSGWVAGQYVDLGREKLAQAEPAKRFEIMRGFARDWWLLRRGDLLLGRLQLDREAAQMRWADSQAGKEKEFRAWLNSPRMQAELQTKLKRGLSEETLRRIEGAMKIL